MKLKTIVVLSVMAAAFIIGGTACNQVSKIPAPASGQTIAYYTCLMHPSVKSDTPGSCHICGMELVPVYASDLATNNASSNATNNAAAENAKPYPFDTCLVDGMKLGSMGDPYVFVYQGQEIKFCCADCKPVFLKDADKYMKNIQDAETAAQK